MKCTYFPTCQGCSYWNISYLEQSLLKTKNLESLFLAERLSAPAIEFVSCGPQGLRHRLDFTIQEGPAGTQQMGFYDQDRNLIDIAQCLQLSPELQQFFSEFRSIHFPIKKGSARLRVGPTGLRGCWLDFSNFDIKYLLEEKSILQSLIDKKIHVEVGQKGKKVTSLDGVLKLSDPEPMPWFETYDADLKALPLKALVSDFTQPSWYSAKKMVETLFDWTATQKTDTTAIEFGPGLGQFTLALLAKGLNVSVFENDASATECLKLNATENKLAENLKIHLGDYQNKSLPDSAPVDFALVNPPRSGLKKFTQELIRTNAKSCIYISCFPESMVEDLKQLIEAGYVMSAVKIIDQFPQTKHYEVCVKLQKSFF